ncbi:MAG: hypothetical protein RMM07_02125 [Anaerolineae bacterium]|uniref:hypothetical protein n=1 Tax=Thermoflexus sp. TaxID=1969742 RepID=UPI0025F74598|nr:hypothetical protein [Thermoflexus sp.]MCS7351998.1 hypothetical protein [Thermoflexus sp.]MDW8181457.1 hypothetical protein [Anaerolineae bacterium]MDW8184036.1 hypothetical protein [Anaerolineae bacterium]
MLAARVEGAIRIAKAKHPSVPRTRISVEPPPVLLVDLLFPAAEDGKAAGAIRPGEAFRDPILGIRGIPDLWGG